ncbi:Bacitracin transport permease protein BCRC [hydrothermal vent metagenome]|uniref:Bacitracin transport permease protein BCRC n=1 Tax=hydrothermal vent metagenome TaxID=652676 RepID=A0A3B1E8Y1_9ZZZZ
MEELNQSLFLKINSLVGTHHTIDFLGIVIGEYMPYLFILVELLLYFIFKKKNIVIFAFMSMVLALGINQLIGLFYFHNRPFMDGLGTTLVHHTAESSFPSDHTTFMFGIAIYLFMSMENKILGQILLVLAFIGGMARVFIGVHYPFDIIVSIITATIASLIIYKFQHKLQPINNLVFKIENKIFSKNED